ncbi:PIG-L deacetylase family protein [Alphaproteobacteria bacterium LSUCC0744]
MKTLVVAPHADDELLGCGGTLLRRVDEGGTVAWLLMTEITEEAGWAVEKIQQRAAEIERVSEGLQVARNHFYALGFPTTELERIPMHTLVRKISEVFANFKPDEVLLPYAGDVHSDHRVTFEAASACTKWFRYLSVKRVLAYETPSETDFGIDPRDPGFKPNVFVDVSDQIERKIELTKIYTSEMGQFPFPRSEKALIALAQLRGSQAGFEAAEAFMLLRERS